MGIATLLLWFAPLSFGMLLLGSLIVRAMGFSSDKALGFVAVSTAILAVGFVWSRHCLAQLERGNRIADSTRTAAAFGFSYVHVFGYVLLFGVPTAEPDYSLAARAAIVLVFGVVFVTAVAPGMALGEQFATERSSA